MAAFKDKGGPPGGVPIWPAGAVGKFLPQSRGAHPPGLRPQGLLRKWALARLPGFPPGSSWGLMGLME